MLIIFGTKNIGKTISRGTFSCVRCNTERQYQLKENRKYFSLFFIPVIPLEKQGDTLECTFCKTVYFPETILPEGTYIPTTLAIDQLDQPLASFGKRIGSYFIDLIFLVFLNFPLAWLSSLLDAYLPKNYFLVFLPVWGLYFFLMEWLLKGTLGKKICGIVIVADAEDKSVNVLRYFIRAIIKSIPILGIVMFFNEKRKGVHDLVADTIVVEKI